VRAVVLRGVGDVRVEEVPEPRIELPTDALVEVRASAICGADLFPFHGLTPGFENGTVLGHEFVGVVHETGESVASVKAGDRVVNTSLVLDGTCPACRAGRPTQCSGRALFGYSGVYPRLDGGQAQLVRVPNADRVLAILPEEISDEAGVFLSDNLPTGYDAVLRGETKPGDTVCVVGLGAVGQMAVMCAVDAGAHVIAVDGVETRREIAGRLGARPASPDEAGDAVAEATEGMGADVVVEAAGSPSALDAALRLARGRGVVSVVGAHFEPDYPLNNGLMFERELTLRFSIGDSAGHRPLLLGLLGEGRLRPEVVVTHRLALADAAEAYRLFDTREATKVVLVP
jgi:2-desacetyl-2-hydroxyethyl bacteriochlorophyllide A dehydrogenase